MGCPVGAWEQMVKLFNEGGMTLDEAKREATNAMKPEEIAAGRIPEKELGTALEALRNDGYSTTNDAQQKALIEKASTLSLTTLEKSGLIEDTKFTESLKQSTGVDYNAIKAVGTTVQELFRTGLGEGGRNFNDLSENERKQLAALYNAGDPDAVALINGMMDVAYSKQYEKYTSGEQVITSIGMLSALGEGGWTAFDVEKSNLPNRGVALETYKKFYDDINNIPPERRSVVDGGIYPKVEWKSKLQTVHGFDVASGGLAYNPVTQTYDPNFKISREYKDEKGYNRAKMELNLQQYAEDIASGKLTPKTQQQIDEVNKYLVWLMGEDDNYKDTQYWTCTGTLCDALYGKQGEGSGGGGGGGGGSGGGGGGSSGYRSSGYTSTPTEKSENGSLYVECNVNNAEVWSSSEKIGNVNSLITLKKGTYEIEVKATGYTTRRTSVTIGNYAVSKTMNLTRKPPSISTFINGMGGIQNLTRDHYLYAFCIYKQRKTSTYDWKAFADSVVVVPQEAIPTSISKDDVMYLYYILNGETSLANQLVLDGKVTLDEEDVVLEDGEGAEQEGGV